jgi:hypothetical protein
LGDDCICPGCRVRGRLVFTGNWVNRVIVWPEASDLNKNKDETIKIVLARCLDCQGRFRVLPAEILPYKRFSLPLIEKYCRIYFTPELDGPDLRKTVAGPPGNYPRPHYTTLHRWLTFLGERILDRLPLSSQSSRGSAPRFSFPIPWLPTSALISESAKRLQTGIKRWWNHPVKIPSWKYKSPRRREQLQACARLLATASHLFPDDPHPLTAWEGKIIEYLNVAGWWFPSGYACTAKRHDHGRPDVLECPANLKKREKEVNHGPRSPPDGLFSF